MSLWHVFAATRADSFCAGSIEVGSGEAPSASAASESEECSLPLHELLDVRLGDRSSAVRIVLLHLLAAARLSVRGSLLTSAGALCRCSSTWAPANSTPRPVGAMLVLPQTPFAHFRR